MISAISSSTSSYYSGIKHAAAGLEAELSKYQKVLGDCIDCSSSKTPEGKKNIQEISNKISALQAQINQISNTPADKPEDLNSKNAQETSTQQLLSAVDPSATIGRHLDVYAW